MIDQEARFDGFYGICTNLEDEAEKIIRVNGGRWIIEDCFRITKTEFSARPVQKTRHLVRKWQEVYSLRATVGRYSIAYRP